jgi:hypothetical protein
MRTRMCRSLLWAAVILVPSLVVGPAAAIGPGPLVSCKSRSPAGDPNFGYMPTTWRPWPVSHAPTIVSVPMAPAHPGGVPARTGTLPAPDMEKAH